MMKTEGKSNRGRKTDYRPAYNDQVYKLCLLGAKDTEIADFFSVSEKTLNTWKKKQPKFLQSMKKGKEIADATVAQKLYHRAVGYEHPEDKIFNDSGKPMVVPTTKHYPPEPVAAIFWLKNRQPAKWRDKQEIDHTSLGEKIISVGTIPIVVTTPEQAAKLNEKTSDNNGA